MEAMKLPIEELQEKAKDVRRDILQMIYEAGSGHPGGSLSAADILTVLYFHFMRVDPERPDWPDRDRFILSKGHACPVWYAALVERGFFAREHLHTLRRTNSILQGHAHMLKTPGVDISTGSLGQGLSDGLGMALAGKLLKKDYRVYVLIGDGEVQEGQIWEAAMAGAKWKLDNLTAFLDCNRLQNDGEVASIMPVDPLADKWRAFNWQVMEVDGHDMAQIIDAVHTAQATRGKPTIIIAHTIKGKGVSFMEDVAEWHGNAPNKEQYEQAIWEIEHGG
jgi:transketolase